MLEHNPTSYHEIPLEHRTRSEILPMVMREGMAFFPYSPLFQGLLTDAFSRTGNFDENDVRAANPKLNGEAFDAYYEAAQRLRRLAGELGRPLNQFAINWLASQAAVTSVIAGGQTPEHVTANAAAVTWDVTAEVFDRVDGILAPYAERGLIGPTHCCSSSDRLESEWPGNVQATMRRVGCPTRHRPWCLTVRRSSGWCRWWCWMTLSLIHISEPTRRTPISYAVFCLKKKKK